jgi:glycosyltransferase involved in cell wall biosynthesis
VGEALARAGAPRAKLRALVYAFDAREYRPRARPAGPARLGFLGQLGPHKGFACVIEATRELARLAPNAEWELSIYGRPAAGRHRRYAEAALARADPRRVRLAAPFEPDHAPAVLGELAALVAPSEWDENAPLAVLQARALGLPVIATDVPGIAELVRAPAHGRLVPVGDARALAGALLEVVDGRLTGPLEPGLPLALDAHLARLEDLYAEARAPARASAHD